MYVGEGGEVLEVREVDEALLATAESLSSQLGGRSSNSVWRKWAKEGQTDNM
jgi:hypothetical protein